MSETMTARSAQDEALDTAAFDALMHYPGVRVWTDALDIRAQNGILEISGHVRTHAEKQVTEDVIIKVKGVKDVINNLYVDTDLELAVAQALGNDARTRGGFPGILVGSAFGEIYLKGSVPSQEMKKAAGEITAKIEGVRDVVNSLEAPEPPKPPAPAAAAKPAAGARPAAAAKPAPKEEGEEQTPTEE
jgi:osmotically-inducible protein OsmY